MSFEKFTAEQYRALDIDSLNERRDSIVALYDGDTVDTETLDQESAMITAEYERRQKVANLRGQQIAAVKAGAGKVVERKEVTPAAGMNVLDTEEYKRAFMDFMQRGKQIPMEYRVDTQAVATDAQFEGDYTATTQNKVMVPTSMGNEIIRKLREEYGQLYNKVRKTSVKGGLWFRIADMELEAVWLGDDTKVSKYQKAKDGDQISFSYFELECRFSQTLLAAAVTWDDFQAMFADEVARAMAKAIDMAIIAGEGAAKSQPMGIINDPRVRANGTVINIYEGEIDDWKFMRQLFYAFPRLYRNSGTFCFGDLTWGMHLDVLEDSEHNPLGKYDPLNDAEPYKILNRPVELFDEDIIPSWDAASAGDVIGIYGDFRNYLLNTQPGMPLSTVRWIDHEENKEKTKALVALDGKVLDPYGFVLLVKKSGKRPASDKLVQVTPKPADDDL